MYDKAQKKYDKALIAMPSCFVSSAYENNPYYKDFETLFKWGKEKVENYIKYRFFNKSGYCKDSWIVNNEDFKLAKEWVKYCETL